MRFPKDFDLTVLGWIGKGIAAVLCVTWAVFIWAMATGQLHK